MSLLVVFLLVRVWVLGLLNGYAFGGLIRVLLVYAGLIALAWLLQRHLSPPRGVKAA